MGKFNNPSRILFIAIILFATTNLLNAQETNSPVKVDSNKIYSPEIGYLKIYTDYKEIYDDGMNRKLFSGYTIMNLEGNKIMKVTESLDYPKTIKLKAGSYKIVTKTNDGLKKNFEVIVEGGKTTEINDNI